MLENGKIIIELFREKKPEDFTKSLADKDSRAETGSASALTAANASALALRAARYAAAGERTDYLLRNLEILRSYMINLIDEDIKCRAPMRKAQKVGGKTEIDACRHPACAINEEIICMLLRLLELDAELIELVPDDTKHYVGESVTLAKAAMDISRSFILSMVKPSSDETYKFVTRRENEITFAECEKTVSEIMEKVNKALI